MSKQARLPALRQKLEWVGGEIPSFSLPSGSLSDTASSTVRIWLELPTMEIVGSAIGPPESLPSFAETFLQTARRPMKGRPRLPGQVRVADPALADGLRGVAASGMHVRVAPTPEIEAFLEYMTQALTVIQSEQDYLAAGRIRPEVVERMFKASAILYDVAPWKVATDDQVIRVDVPDRDLHGAFLSIIGKLEQGFGFLLFPTFDDYMMFLEDSVSNLEEDQEPGSDWLALNFVSQVELTSERVQQIERYGWRVAGNAAYPLPFRSEAGQPAIIQEGDVELLTRLASALSTFVIRNGKSVFARSAEPTSQSFTDRDGFVVRLTYPAEDEALFDFDETPSQQVRQVTRVGTNEPCPCGSGQKFKKCCLDRKVSADSPARDQATGIHEMDRDLVERILKVAKSRWGDAFFAAFEDFESPASSLQLVMPYAAYCFAIGGEHPVDLFMEQKGRNLLAREREWLEAQRRSWLSVWETENVEPGIALTVVDLLTGERRRVLEKSGSQNVRKRDTMLGRVVDFEGIAVLCGSHPRPLPPRSADEVVQRIRKHLRLKGSVKIERLRDYGVCRRVLEFWEDEVVGLEFAATQRPSLTNTDGDPFLLTVDRFSFEPSSLSSIESALSRMNDVIPPDPASPERCYTFERTNAHGSPLPSTTVGTVWIKDGILIVETNAIKRADALRSRLEEACGSLLKPLLREHADPWADKRGADKRGADKRGADKRGADKRGRGGRVPSEKDEIPEEVRREILLDFKKRHYAVWLDQPIPALDGQTPRGAARTATGRHRLNVLLKDMENTEQHASPNDRFDFAELRRELGLNS